MSVYWYLTAILLVFGFTTSYVKGGQIVERLTGREPKPDKSSSIAYETIYFAMALGIGIPPIYLIPNADPLVTTAFILFGILVGGLTAQAILGRRHV